MSALTTTTTTTTSTSTSTYHNPPPAYAPTPGPPSYQLTLSRTLASPYSSVRVLTAVPPNSNTTPPSLSKRNSFFRKSKPPTSQAGSIDPPILLPPVVDSQTLLPPTFRVGLRHVAPLVEVRGMGRHLGLLAALENERENERWESDGNGDEGLPREVKRSLQAITAEGEFERWIHTLEARSRSESHRSTPAQPKQREQFEQQEQERTSGRTSGSGTGMGWEPEDLPPTLAGVGVWHAYVLNPRWYRDDLQNNPRLRILNKKPGFPLDLITLFIDPETLRYTPPSASSPSTHGQETGTIPLQCPLCQNTSPVPLLTDSQTGYAQKGFQTRCPQCSTHLTRDLLRVVKFLKACADVTTGEREVLPGMGSRPSLGTDPDIVDRERGRLFSQVIARMFVPSFDPELKVYPVQKSGKPSESRSREAVIRNLGGFKKEVQPFSPGELVQGQGFRLKSGNYLTAPNVQELLAFHQTESEKGSLGSATSLIYYQEVIQAAITDKRFRTWIAGFKTTDEFDRRLGKMWSAFRHEGMASLNLAEATKRQAGFVEKMREMGWLERGRFDGEGKSFLLQKSAARYHAFLDLMASHPEGFLCPTLDIDLAWHTHQLHAHAYYTDTTRLIGRFVDHDDKVSETRLGDAYTFTAKKWLKRFGVPYSACGCHQGEGMVDAITGGVDLVSAFKFWDRNKESQGDRKARFVLEMDEAMEPEERESTHPSTHNIVRVRGLVQEEHARTKRQRLNAILDQRDAQGIPSNIKDPEKAQLAQLFRKKAVHQDPFLYRAKDDSFLGYQDSNKDPRYQSQAGDLQAGRSGRLPYWGVGMGLGAGVVIGGAAVWGLAQDDCHEIDGQETCNNRGACAVGIGSAGGGYCGGGGNSTGTGACCSGACGTNSGSACGGGFAGGSCGGGGGGGCGGGGGGGGGGGCGGGGC